MEMLPIGFQLGASIFRFPPFLCRLSWKAPLKYAHVPGFQEGTLGFGCTTGGVGSGWGYVRYGW